ncbi:MAG: conjugative coupling factor TraD, PFGI-1 class, partial [Gammaproteobacteria bacterium]|nr:conjugative coupling factor TraD, PFGI-1 class [Gammaproteobacteria bacterium]
MGPTFDNRLRPVIEFIPATVLLGLAGVLLHDPVLFFPLLPALARIAAAGLGALGLLRLWQGCVIIRYRRQLRRLPRYVLNGQRIPLSRHKLFLGRGFAWDQRHSQRLVEARSPQARRWLEPGVFYRAARAFELRFEHSLLLGWVTRLTRLDSGWNPLRPLPPLGGDPALHGVGLEDERPIWM